MHALERLGVDEQLRDRLARVHRRADVLQREELEAALPLERLGRRAHALLAERVVAEVEVAQARGRERGAHRAQRVERLVLLRWWWWWAAEREVGGVGKEVIESGNLNSAQK